MKHSLKAVAVAIFLSGGVFTQAQETNRFAGEERSQVLTQDSFVPSAESGELVGSNDVVVYGGGSGAGAPLPINDYEYALMAAGIAIAGYAALRARKQNA